MDGQENTELLRPNRFAETYPHIASIASLRWQLVNSSRNGLDVAGAVVRKHTGHSSRRPIVFINVPAYFRWLRNETGAAA